MSRQDKSRGGRGKNLRSARKNKNDEFYTQLSDIEKELVHYENHFKNKVVYCNCDDPRKSNFFHYFSFRFDKLGLSKLITSCYKNNNPDLFTLNEREDSIYLEYKKDKKGRLIPYPEFMKRLNKIPKYSGDVNNKNIPNPNDIGIGYLKGDGDFRSPECIELLKKADVVVTNPPFSLLVDYVEILMKYNKEFIIIGTINSMAHENIFTYIKNNKIWLGINYGRNFNGFIVPDNYELYGTEARMDDKDQRIVSTNATCWFTNLSIKKMYEDIYLNKKYSREEYPKYDNYDAINIDKTEDIPSDYDGTMGVPITFLIKHNPNQFEILGKTHSKKHGEKYFNGKIKDRVGIVRGVKKYHRVFIRNKRLGK